VINTSYWIILLLTRTLAYSFKGKQSKASEWLHGRTIRIINWNRYVKGSYIEAGFDRRLEDLEGCTKDDLIPQ
jgi:hypothetical protein